MATTNKSLQTVREELASKLDADVKNRDRKIRINGAKEYLRQSGILDDLDADIKEAIEAVAKISGRGGAQPGAPRTSPVVSCINELVERGFMTDVECFMEFKKGPAEMRSLMKYAVRKMSPEDRVWIEFKNDQYTVVAIGEDEPEDWDGYRPVETEMDI